MRVVDLLNQLTRFPGALDVACTGDVSVTTADGESHAIVQDGELAGGDGKKVAGTKKPARKRAKKRAR